MTILKPRNRMISIRLSEDEYLALRRECSNSGSRSVSEFTREAVRSILEESGGLHGLRNGDGLATQMRLLTQRIDELYEWMLSSKSPSQSQ